MPTNVTIQNQDRLARPAASIDGRVQTAINRIAQSDCPVLLMGEHGVGKRSLATQLHAQSNRSRRSFEEVPCGAANSQELLTALRNEGTVYLSEVGDLSLPLQEVVMNSCFQQQTPHCRLLCGSSRELQDEVRSRRFREDFFYRISTVTLTIPPLRHRKAEIVSIADGLIARYSKQFDRPRPALGAEITGLLMGHDWPDNLSELETALKTLVVIGDQAISLAAFRAAYPSGRSNGSRRHVLLKEATRASSIQVERQLISEVMVSTSGNRKRAAMELGISYKALLYKLKRIAIEDQRLTQNHGV